MPPLLASFAAAVAAVARDVARVGVEDAKAKRRHARANDVEDARPHAATRAPLGLSSSRLQVCGAKIGAGTPRRDFLACGAQ